MTTASLRGLAQDHADRLEYAQAARLQRLAIERYPRGSGALRERDLVRMAEDAVDWEHAALAERLRVVEAEDAAIVANGMTWRSR